jgi:hypothetical protein
MVLSDRHHGITQSASCFHYYIKFVTTDLNRIDWDTLQHQVFLDDWLEVLQEDGRYL